MKAFNKKLCLLIVVSLELLVLKSFVQGQIKTIVMVSPSSMKVQPSHTAAIDVKVEGSENLFASSVTLAFDMVQFCAIAV